MKTSPSRSRWGVESGSALIRLLIQAAIASPRGQTGWPSGWFPRRREPVLTAPRSRRSIRYRIIGLPLYPKGNTRLELTVESDIEPRQAVFVERHLHLHRHGFNEVGRAERHRHVADRCSLSGRSDAFDSQMLFAHKVPAREANDKVHRNRWRRCGRTREIELRCHELDVLTHLARLGLATHKGAHHIRPRRVLLLTCVFVHLYPFPFSRRALSNRM